ADVDERPGRGDVADHAFQDHPDLQVLDLLDTVGEARGLELRTRVAAGLLKLLQDVADGRHAKALVGVLLGPDAAQEAGIADQLLHLAAAVADDALYHRVGLRMHRRGIQRLVAVGDAQEAGALLERL